MDVYINFCKCTYAYFIRNYKRILGDDFLVEFGSDTVFICSGSIVFFGRLVRVDHMDFVYSFDCYVIDSDIELNLYLEEKNEP